MEYLEQYRPGPLEAAIVEFYRRHQVRSPQDIDLTFLAEQFGITITYAPRPSVSFELKSGPIVSINETLPWEQQRVELAHEIGHLLMHAGRQHFMTEDFKALQEWQADRFAMYALAPTFMVMNCLVQAHSLGQLAEQLAYTFDVTVPFMEHRIKMIQQRMQDLATQDRLAAVVAEERSMYDTSFRHPANPRIEYLVKDGRVVHRRLRAEV